MVSSSPLSELLDALRAGDGVDLIRISTRAVDELVEAMGAEAGVSKSEVSPICTGLDEIVAALRTCTVGQIEFSYVYLDATYLNVRDATGRSSRWGSESVGSSGRRGRFMPAG